MGRPLILFAFHNDYAYSYRYIKLPLRKNGASAGFRRFPQFSHGRQSLMASPGSYN